jgi:F0F1-type ATP synthase assembly protein I
MGEPEKLSTREERKKILLYISGVGMGVGSELIALAVAGLWIGNWVDRNWSLSPYGTLGFTLLFLGVGLTHITFILIKMQKKLESLKEDKEGSEKS